MNTKLIESSIKYAHQEIEQYNLPPILLFDISMKEGILLAQQLDANAEVVRLGMAFIDLKLGQAFSEGKMKHEHITMSIESAQKFLEEEGAEQSLINKVLECIEYHHNNSGKFPSLEAEICANADCYRFLLPRAVLYYMSVVSKRFDDIDEVLDQVESKMDEKINIVSLPSVTKELEPHYKIMKEYIKNARA